MVDKRAAMFDSGERDLGGGETVVTTMPRGDDEQVQKQACLVCIYGEELGKRIALTHKPVVIGRSPDSEFHVPQDSVSRQHCKVYRRNNRYFVEDLGSTNGSYVNDEIVDQVALRDGDQIKIGQTMFKFLLAGNIEAQYHEEIYRLMTVDGLTELMNKRCFEETLDKEVARALRYERQFSLILFDIDHFKAINDTHGHLAGDAVLRQLGILVKERVRTHDIAARVGGEEFAVMLPESNLAGAVKLAHAIREMTERHTFSFEDTDIPVTLSLGVTQWRKGYRNADDLLREVDSKLYEAKRTGRNRVCVSEG